jgi:hypothetical protein
MNLQQQPPDFGLRHYFITHQAQTRAQVEQVEATFHAWSAIIQFDQLISDIEVFALLKLAYNEMMVKSSAENLESRHISPVMTALIGPDRKTIIFASSIKKISGHFSLSTGHFYTPTNSSKTPWTGQSPHLTIS